jgi:hypothetical protein
MVEAPVGVDTEVVIVTVVVQEGLQDVGESAAVAPDGRPDTWNDTACVAPDDSVAVTVLETAAPRTTDRLPPFDIVKSKGAAGVVTATTADCGEEFEAASYAATV